MTRHKFTNVNIRQVYRIKMATLSHKNYPKKSNMSQLNYNYEYSGYDSCTEGMSSDEEEEIDNVFLNECVNDEINNSDDS